MLSISEKRESAAYIHRPTWMNDLVLRTHYMYGRREHSKIKCCCMLLHPILIFIGNVSCYELTTSSGAPNAHGHIVQVLLNSCLWW